MTEETGMNTEVEAETETTEEKAVETMVSNSILPQIGKENLTEELDDDLKELLATAELKEKLAEISMKIAQRRPLTDEEKLSLPPIIEEAEVYDLSNAKRKCKLCWGKGYYIQNDVWGIRTDVTCNCVVKHYIKKGDPKVIYLSQKEYGFFKQLVDRFDQERKLSEEIADAEGLQHSNYRVVSDTEDETEIRFEIKSEDPLGEDQEYIGRPIKNKNGGVIGQTIGVQKVDDYHAVISALVNSTETEVENMEEVEDE